MRAPSIDDHVEFSGWIYGVEKPVNEIDDDETVFPGVEPIMSFTSVNIFCSEQVK